MKTKLLKIRLTFSVTMLFLLINVVGMMQGFAQRNVPTGAINGRFSVSENQQVYFAKGNLQYNAMAHSWRFAENQYDYVGAANNNISSEYNGWIDLFGWGTSGYHDANDPYNVNYQPWSTSISEVNSSYNYYGYGPSTNMSDPNLTGTSANYDWGVYNPIINGGNTANQWRTLTQPEWEYVFFTRTTTSGILYAKANVNNVNGIILLPDDWNSSTYSLSNTNTPEASFSSNTLTVSQWSTLEQAGAVFLPAAGYRYDGTSIDQVGSLGQYWTASGHTCLEALRLAFFDLNHGTYGYYYRCNGLSVRLVSMNAVYTSYNINATPNPSDGGTIMGAGTYQAGETCTLTATANEGYTFINWTENSEVVSTEAEYTFTVDGDRALVANFELANIAFADDNVKALCVANWDTNGDGELSYEEAAAVTDLGTVFKQKSLITSFEEFQYFTGLTVIGNQAFYYCTNLASVFIPNTVTTIESNAFYGCSKLTSIEIPTSVTSIGTSAFRATGLTSIVIPNTITTLETYTFYNCSNLITITLTDGLETINSSAFEGCSKLTTINIPNTVTTIGNKAFCGCSKLASIQIPNSVTTLSGELFCGCSLLANFEIPNTVTTIGSSAFYGCTNLTSIDIPTSVTSIGSGAFSSTSLTSIVVPNSITVLSDGLFTSCHSLTSVVIPNTVTEIGSSVFKSCEKLAAIDIPSSVITIGNGAFRECEKLTTITIPNSVTTIGSNAFWNCTRLLSVEMGNSVETIGNSAFKGCEKLETINIPNTVETIGNEAFSNCKKLTEIVIPNSVISIGNSAFSGCSYLESVEIGNSVETIGNSAFSSCTSLTSIVIPNSVISIDNFAFNGCSYLESVVIGNSVETIGTNVFNGCSRLESIVIPNYVVTIGSSAFKDCVSLTSVQLGNSVQTIGTSAFEGCSLLTSLAIPETVQSIGSNIIANCSNLEQLTVIGNNLVYDSRDNCNAIIKKNTNELVVGCKTTVIPNTVVSIGSNAFDQNSELIGINIPNSVTTIGNYAFYKCTGLTALEIPKFVTSIGSAAFQDCTGLTQLTVCAETPPTLGTNAFKNVTKSIPVYVKSASINAYQSATGWNYFDNFQAMPSYNVVATANPAEGGEVSGAGTYEVGEICTLTATANEGYTFINWTENNEVVSTEAEYTFTVDGDRTLVANFEMTNITFADDNVKALCVANWDANDDGELSYAEAAAVTDLGEVFKNNTTITSFDELQYFTGLTTIGWEAFAWCHNLTSIVLPSSITSIDGGAFNDCRNLLSITIPAAVTEIGFAALTCDNLETIIVEQGNTVYDSRDNCNAVINTSSNELIRGCKNTVIPNTVVSLYDHAFASCSMESINIPASVTNISTSAFYLCGNLATITVDANNVVYDSRNNSNAIIQTNTNKLVAGSKTTVIPNTVTAIGEYAFSNRFSIGSFSVTIPESVTLIEQNAYLGGYGIESISVLADIPPTLQSYAFAYVDKTIPVNVPCGTRSAYQAAEGWSEFTNITVDPECGRQITVTVNPANTGNVTGAGTYELGETCTLTATPNSGYTFVNWTENNEVVSTNATYQFTVNANRDLVANFEEYVVTNHYVCDISQFADYMSVVAVVVIDGVEQGSETLEIGAFCENECRGGKFATYFPPTQRYIYQIPVYGEGGDEITFKLYNHDLQQELDLTCTVELQWNKDGYGRLATPYEITFVSTVNISASVNPEIAGTVSGTGDYLPGTEATLTATANNGYVFANWTEGGNVVSENAVYTFTVEAARSLVANFNAAQSYTLNSGWNWWSTYIEQNGADGLTMLEEGLGEHGEFIQSRTGTMVENFDGSFWWGDLNAVTNEDMYEVKTNAQVSVTMTGSVANPASHPITVAPGWNWIGYVSDASNTVGNALSSLTPNEDDIIQSRNAFSSYFPGWGWYGDLENMTPGQGYMYKSRGTASQTLVYPTAIRSINTEVVDYHYNANYNKYRDVMDVMAKVVINGNLPASDRYELAAFVGGECRGRAKLQYVEPMDTYMAFLTINGNDDEQVTFELYDEDQAVNYAANEANVIVFKAKEVAGRFSNPYILYFGNSDMAENNAFTVYPNPAAKGDEITINFEEDIVEAELFVENELGLTVDVIKLSGTQAKVRLDLPSGVYVLRVVTEGNIYYNKVIVK